MNDMFSSLGQIFVTPPRHTETADARMNIRRHDPEQERRKKKKGEDSSAVTFDMTDTAVVSVEALEIFLTNFINSQNDQQPGAEKKGCLDLEKNFKNGAGHTAAYRTSQAAKAANAYQSSARISSKKSMLDTTDDNQAHNEKVPSFQVSAAERRMLHGLLEKVQILRRQSVEFLNIEKQESFLASLESAVDQALAQNS